MEDIAMAIVRFDPFRELTAMQDRLNRVFGDVYKGREEDLLARGAWVPSVDIFENDQHDLVIKAELPDIKREDIDLRIENNMLTLRGEKKMDSEVKEEQYHRVERMYGTFTRSFALPPTVDTTNVHADYKNGVLEIRLPRREEAKPKQIQVQVNG
jgi:HSP20 family protein